MPESLQWLKKMELSEFPQPEVIPLRYPVMMCHGYGALVSIIKPSPMHDACMKLREHGVIAFAPNIVPYARIETRAEQWAERIRRIIDRYDFRKLNIVAHSMGGLDMRYAICRLGLHEQVASLTTVATPHRGTSLAELALEAPEGVRDSLAEILDWFGNTLYPRSPSDSVAALEQLTRRYLHEEFNPACPDHDQVSYFSWSAAVGKGTDHPLNPIYRYQNNHIFEEEGINDSWISVESARWGEHLGTVPLSHVEQIHLSISRERKAQVDRFWVDLVRTLAERGL